MNSLIDKILPNEPGSASRRFFLSSALWLFAGISVALIAAVIIGAVVILGGKVNSAFTDVNDTLTANGH